MSGRTAPAARAGSAPAGGGELLTTAEAAHVLRRTPKTLRSWRYLNVGPPYLAGGRVLYRRADLDAWLERQLVRPA
jgi:hypothetical protein